MPVKIRLQRKGRRKQPFYHIVVADARAPRDGKFIEKIGSYNPMTSPATIEVDTERAVDWMFKGAQPTDTARAILRFKGVLYLKHLTRGVKKGAFSQEVADQMYTDFMNAKNDRVASRVEQSKQADLDRMAAISGAATVFTPVAEVVEETEEATEATEETAEAVVEEATEAVPEAVEAAPEAVAEAVEVVKEEVAETAEEVTEAAAEVVEEVTEAATEVAEQSADQAEAASEDVKDAAKEA